MVADSSWWQEERARVMFFLCTQVRHAATEMVTQKYPEKSPMH